MGAPGAAQPAGASGAAHSVGAPGAAQPAGASGAAHSVGAPGAAQPAGASHSVGALGAARAWTPDAARTPGAAGAARIEGRPDNLPAWMSEERGDSGRDPEGPSAVHLCGSVRGSSLAGAALRVAPAAAPARAALSRGGGYQRSQRAASPRWGKSLPWSGGVDIRVAAEYPGERTGRISMAVRSGKECGRTAAVAGSGTRATSACARVTALTAGGTSGAAPEADRPRVEAGHAHQVSGQVGHASGAGPVPSGIIWGWG